MLWRGERRFAAELSARPMDAAANPALPVLIARLEELLGARPWRLADQGCGRLRHLEILRRLGRLYCVDIGERLDARTELQGSQTTVRAFVGALGDSGVSVVDAEAFAESRLGLDVVVNVATLDIVPPRERYAILAAARRNLAEAGRLAVIVPNGNEWIREKHAEAEPHEDGFAYRKKGVWRFFRQYTHVDDVGALLDGAGFRVEADLSDDERFALVGALD